MFQPGSLVGYIGITGCVSFIKTVTGKCFDLVENIIGNFFVNFIFIRTAEKFFFLSCHQSRVLFPHGFSK